MLDIITWTPRCTDLSLARSTRLSVITINAFDREKDPADHNASAVQSAPTNVDRRALRANSIETTEYFVSSFTLQPPHDAELSGYTYLACKDYRVLRFGFIIIDLRGGNVSHLEMSRR